MKLDARERKARTLECSFCHAAPGKPCVYADGPYRGTVKSSGAHAARVIDALDAELDAR